MEQKPPKEKAWVRFFFSLWLLHRRMLRAYAICLNETEVPRAVRRWTLKQGFDHNSADTKGKACRLAEVPFRPSWPISPVFRPYLNLEQNLGLWPILFAFICFSFLLMFLVKNSNWLGSKQAGKNFFPHLDKNKMWRHYSLRTRTLERVKNKGELTETIWDSHGSYCLS